jgi:NDP-sugar pyrophosphorylase family protein
MKAMVLAAGLGTRLYPITAYKPKALIEVKGIPLLEIIIKKLKQNGFNEIIINVHHHAEQIISFIKKKKNFNIQIAISDETEKLLGTGGGIKKASWFLKGKEPFLVHNVDIVSNIDLRKLYGTHKNSDALVTLAVQHRNTDRYLLFDSKNNLKDWETTQMNKVNTPEKFVDKYIPFAFTGIHIINPEIFNLMPEQDVFSIVDFYLQISTNHKIKAFNCNKSIWIDVGKKESLSEADKIFNQIMGSFI